MSLSFTTIPDRHGAAVYLLSDGLSTTHRTLTDLANEVLKSTPDTQIVLIEDTRRGEGRAIVEFYGITSLPAILIVMDDDTVPHSWLHTLPSPSEVSYQISQINGSMRAS